MELRKEDMPATIQAFDLQGDHEIFVAEQVVNNQSEVEKFTSRYAGKLIKAKKLPISETYANTYNDANTRKQRSSAGIIIFMIILIIIALVIYGFSTGWIQEKLNIKM